MAKFNAWEVDSPAGDRLDMQPAPLPKGEGECFWGGEGSLHWLGAANVIQMRG